MIYKRDTNIIHCKACFHPILAMRLHFFFKKKGSRFLDELIGNLMLGSQSEGGAKFVSIAISLVLLRQICRRALRLTFKTVIIISGHKGLP